MCLNPGDILRDRYQIIDTLGEGGFATTYRANVLDSPENSPCVVKEIRSPQSNDPGLLEEAQQRFQREVAALRRLGHHSRIPEYYESFLPSQENRNFYLVQEYIEGNPLSQELASGPQWTEEKTIAFLRDLLEILSFVHQNRVIHRDLKPSNLIRKRSGKIVLIDFGAVKEISSLEITESGQTRTRTIHTPGYAPPEQMHGNPQFCSDIYAAGIIAIQAVIGLRPAIDLLLHPQGYIVWHYSTPYRPIAKISHQLETVLNKMVSYDFARRYQSAVEVLQDLDEIAAPQLQSPPPQLVALTTATPHPSAAEVLPDLERLSLAPENSPLSEAIALPPTSHSRPKRQQFSRYLFNRLLRAVAAMVAGQAALICLRIIQPPTCPLIQGDALSCGEEILVTSSSPRLKQRGVEEFANSNYRSAFDLFKKSWNEEYGQDPETLIYMNNAFLEASNTPYYTIAIALPLSSPKNPDRSDIMADRAKEILRGLAQAQTEVNLGLPNFSSNKDFPGQGFLPSQAINGKGLKVIIGDDANDGKKAKEIARALVDRPDILAVVGHSNSDMTMHAVDIYNKNNLVLISPGTATEELTYKPRKFFFRTLYTSSVIAKKLADYIIAQQQKKVVILYSPTSPFSADFKNEYTKYFRDIRGGKIVRIRDFDLSKKDFNAQRAIEEIQASGETALVLVPDDLVTESMQNAFEIMKLNGSRNWISGSWTLMQPQTLELASRQQQKLFKKLIFSVSWHPLNSPNKEFPQQARSLWGGEVNTRTASTYDATRAIVKALEMQLEIQQEPSRNGMQKTLASTDFSAQGATGIIQFNSPDNGDRKNPPSELVHIVKCPKEQFGLAFVPVKYSTASSAGLNCD
ncbi:bifunctional serine/threonine-protein kinase/ABC transporter substrate-binding protein [Microcoleus sp. ARI1-B5]|uniref:bifunctional serine/threonine-protein kinase/ABC transporter substrate-binding protein n=1 Tax=unclassified Microcoleus TaxID=2642155 RepID=UPI002FD76164